MIFLILIDNKLRVAELRDLNLDPGHIDPKAHVNIYILCIMSILKADEKFGGVPDDGMRVCDMYSSHRLREILGVKSYRDEVFALMAKVRSHLFKNHHF